MKSFIQPFDFPIQRVSDAEKDKPEWYANCADWLIAQGIAYANYEDIDEQYNVLHGNIPQDYYKKVLNPYNFTEEKLKRYPATMRNYDLMKGIIRRYISEYIQNPHNFVVSANNPEVVLAKNAKLKKELMVIVEQQIAIELQKQLADWIQQGNNPQEFNPQEQFNIEEYIKQFNENYIDDISAQGSEILKVIQDITEDSLFYARAYFEFVTFGKFFTYTEVVGNKLIKRNVSVRDAFPIPNDSMFAEDFDAFVERRKLSYQQIIDEFGDDLSEEDKKFLDTYYAKHGAPGQVVDLTYQTYHNYFPDVCKKFTQHEIDNIKNNSTIMARDANQDLYDVYHVVWRGERKMAIVKFINESGLLDEKVEIGTYKLNKELGDIDIEYYWEPQVYECTRIGLRNNAIYPYKARAIAYNRNGKLPYNGVCELLPGLGKFSIVDTVLPFQIFYNIVAYEREMAILKNKISVLVLPKSLLGENAKATIHKMLADGVLYVDDEDDQGMLRSQQIRIVNASYGDYIAQLTELLTNIEQTAKNQVDMTPQRYGEIANTAGKGVTEEAIMRGSMGSVIIEAVMDYARERDYARDMDFSKFAWIDGLDTAYRDGDDMKYISLNVNKHMYADYVIKAKNSAKQREKLQQLKQFAFSAAQNGDSMMAVAAITEDNISALKKLIAKLDEDKRNFELQKQQNDAQIEQMKQQFELEKIQVKGEEDRKTMELENLGRKEVALINADANMNSYNNDIGVDIKQEAVNRLNQERSEVDRQRLQFDKAKALLEFASKQEDRRLKEKDIDTKLKIAKTNKNKYDKK